MNRRFQNRCIAGSFVMAVVVAALPSCKKYLDVNPVSSFDAAYTFSNVANATKAVLGAYQSLAGDNGYGIRLSMYYPYDNDLMMGQGSTPFPDNDRRDIAHFSVQPSNTQLAGPFNQLYAGIEKANLCIYYIPQMDAYKNGDVSTKAQLQRLYGEALTLRAQFFTELIRNWGDVPAQFSPSATQTNLFIGKTDRDSIYDHLLNDLQQAETLVPWRTQAGTSNERITQGAVRALRARIALYRGGYSLRRSGQMERRSDYKSFYQIAKDECNVIMQHRSDHTLNPSFQSIFKDNIDAHRIDPSGEVIWEVAMTGGTGSTDSKLGYYDGPKGGSFGQGALTILPTYFYLFDSTDTRRDVTCAPYDVNSDGTKKGRAGQSIVDGKFRKDWITNPGVPLTSSAQYFGINWPLFRFSDVLLMFAEADNELNGGPSAQAIAAYEEVRTRAYGGNSSLIGTTPTDYTGFFQSIVKERALEFGGEGIRKYDLIRWNLINTALSETKSNLALMAAGSPIQPNSYMAPPPSYSLGVLPASMYYKSASTDLIWYNSFYKPSPSSTPGGYTKVAWVNGNKSITSTILTYYAVSFKPNHSELMPLPQTSLDANPNLKQDYGY